MTKAALTVAAYATLLWAGTALATETSQEKCDKARVTAWKAYVSCVNGVVAKDAKGVSFDYLAAFAKCRHTYFKNWTAYQTKASLTGSTCIGSRFTDNGDGTVSDNLTTLVWEKKTTDGSVHDVDNVYTWSTGAPWTEDGTAFTSFLTDPTTGLNVTGFAGANGWRLPTLAELQTIVLDFACSGAFGGPRCSCPSSPCIDGTFGPMQSYAYWSSTTATTPINYPDFAWYVYFYDGHVYADVKYYSINCVRAVRGGL